MDKIKIANAPCSWGALEFDLDTPPPTHLQVLAEIQETGYSGTELGDWGFMPTEPAALRSIVDKHTLDMVGAFVPVALADASAHAKGISTALRVARLLVEAGYPDAFIVLADDNGTNPNRTQNAGRITPAQGLDQQQWKTFAAGANHVAQTVKSEYGLRTVFHHHGAGFVETPSELDQLMAWTDPNLLGLCFDTGHYAFGGGDPIVGLKKHLDRVWHVHFKDYAPKVGNSLAEQGWNYFDAVRNGIFCELGKGNVDFAQILNLLKQHQYAGWIVVEQDVLPGMGTPKAYAQHNRNFLRKLGI